LKRSSEQNFGRKARNTRIRVSDTVIHIKHRTISNGSLRSRADALLLAAPPHQPISSLLSVMTLPSKSLSAPHSYLSSLSLIFSDTACAGVQLGLSHSSEALNADSHGGDAAHTRLSQLLVACLRLLLCASTGDVLWTTQ